MAAPKFKQGLKLLLKLVVTAACFWYISRKIDWRETFSLLHRTNAWWLVTAILLYAFSKIVSAWRLNIYFRNIGVPLSERSNLRLYWLGMFYNLFLPGGIGGDAYKVILLRRKQYANTRPLTSAVLLDRVSGVAGLGIWAIIFFTWQQPALLSWVLLAAIVPGLWLFYLGVRTWFPAFIPGFWPTLFLGMAVQLLQVFAVDCLLASISVHDQWLPYLVLFLLSSMVAVLPITIGGLGARELVFLWGSEHFALNQNVSVYISLLFYLITVLVSASGAIWIFRNPLRGEPLPSKA